ncbi:MAG TPA: type II toxin-antitoxin system HicB family antitoxin [Nitrospinota bacterium]|nr:type II toxin-antitoxin system HicB family antitoxin [Nitrospinota bacterium]
MGDPHCDENKTYHAYVPALPGCHTWGESIAIARKNIKDAIDAYLRSLIADGERIPEDNCSQTSGKRHSERNIASYH